ncbi:MAG: (4Fe-4S)-binding protein [Flavobacteriaceae bacterium]|nr:(4Fe-4S)-binding protein [Flavobacteriaceae bacterium]
MEIKKEYSNGEVTVVWQSKLCTHSAKCAYGLPSVFKPREKPWIQMGGEVSEDIMRVVRQCPSGAISYYEN